MPASQLYLESRKMPFVRLLIALISGILLQWYLAVSTVIWLVIFITVFIGYLLFPLLSTYTAFKLQWLRGVFILMMIAACGGFLCFIKNPFHQKDNYTSVYKPGDAIVATINEALQGKAKSYKANATVTAVYHNKQYMPASGTMLVYISKEGFDSSLQYGSQILFFSPPQEIKGTGNPAAFDYRRYLLFQGITAQVFLKRNEYSILPQRNASSFQTFLNETHNYFIKTLQKYIPARKEQGVAEALLIGYRNDLDKQLVQSYSNTGVVHIIAISGLHIGVIYGFVLLFFSPFKNRRWYRYTAPLVAIAVIWMFALLAGAVPSILRSAVTFSFIAAGMFINKRTNTLNTLAASAFCLLVYNPYFLWDAGFQLSYAAVLGIVLFAKPIFNCLYIQNKLLRGIWQLTCLNLSAQILTLPIVLYNFHQFPLLFIVNNLLVIPLSEIILSLLLLLVIIGKWTSFSILVGKGTQVLLLLMNSIVEHTEKLPFSIWTNIKTDVVQVWLLYMIIVLLSVWLLYQLPRFFLYSLVFAVQFVIYTSIDVWTVTHQSKLIVYNINQHEAIDVVSGTNVLSFSDSLLPNDILANSFYIKPSHTLFRINKSINKWLPANDNLLLHMHGKTVAIISKPLPSLNLHNKLKADIVILTHNSKLYINDLYKAIDCSIIVADNTSIWKLRKWKQDCDSFHIPFYSVTQQGAFVLNL